MQPKEPGFFWGVANAAIQTEGESLPSDWSEWAKIPGKIDDGSTPDQAFGFYRRFEEEFDTAEKLGVNSFRFSIAWERVEPEQGRFDEEAITHYERMALSLRRRGIEPIVTLHHFVNPAWLKEGVLNPEFPSLFARMSERVVGRLSSGPAKVRWWITLNEPTVVAVVGYLDGQFPPGEKGQFNQAVKAIAQLIRAHVLATNRMRALFPPGTLRIGISQHWRPFHPKRKFSPIDRLIAKISDRFFNRQMMKGVMTGKIDVWTPGAKRIQDFIPIEGASLGVDYTGINYYGRSIVGLKWGAPWVAVEEGPGHKTDLGWEIYPEGLLDSLRDLKHYGLPIFITENGLADEEDSRRAQYIRDHIDAIRQARREGIPVLGYLYWTLTDNFEWTRGYRPKFGLCRALPNDHPKRLRPSFEVYRELIRNPLET